MRNKVIFIMGRIASVLGTQLYNFVFALMVLYTTGSAISFAMTIILETLPRILLGTPSGIIADRCNRKKIIVYSDILSAVVLFAAYVVFVFLDKQLIIVFALTFILNSINTFFDVTMNTSLENLFQEDGLEQMCSINEGITSFISLLAPVLGASIYAITDFNMFILLNAMSFLISALSEMFMVYPCKVSDGYEARNISEEIGDTISFLKSERVVFDLYFAAIFINVFYGISASLAFPIILSKYMGASEIEYGIVETVTSVGMLVGASLLSFIKTEKKYKIIILSLLFEAFAILSISLPCFFTFKGNIYYVYVLIAFILGISVSSVNINVRVLMQKMIPDGIKGKVLGTLSSMCLSIGPIAIMCGSIYLEKYNPRFMVMLCGVLFVVMTVILSFDAEMKKV